MFRCINCGAMHHDFHYICPRCGSALLFIGDRLLWKPEGVGVWRYRSMLPVERRVTMYEGGTPLIRRRDVKDEVYLKVEGNNPTGSFKDRGTSVVLSHALRDGVRTVAVASTGNMGASVAAYCAYANLTARVFLPADVPDEKVAQIRAYGACLVRVEGGFQEAVRRMKEEADKGVYLATTGLNPYFLEGLKTVAYEIFEEMGVPDTIIVPTGTGGLLTAIHKGFEELRSLGVADGTPRMVAAQAAAAAPIVEAWRSHAPLRPPEEAESIASAILVKEPYNGLSAIAAMRSSGGLGVEVEDDELISAVRELGKEGVFAEPSAAASLAAYHKIERPPGRTVLIVTGSGLKDPLAALGRS
ncbi:MAG TPA: threonine synthase [Methanomassiliicoccaceae archaeon]|jgi:threonine synthase|nr:threonine synthase [Euryarchaeota archaeon]HOB38760.1 threonine synthase [Methanomassiliicoccaceae archaeon]HOK27680.1 threonine synthase [Methanomassiliicoccaceae archaeon]HOL07162.1 threonine synthase [Methanomassiliicoccaceae archaeon]HOQ26031.1 threonine synthase [Methanomassiliicoccaceae archaeon]